MLANDALVWERDGRDWPNREASRFVRAGGLRWHVQELGRGPVVLLVHGTGASTHSWRGLAPRLAERFTVVAPDLPGHAFSERPSLRGLSLPGMSRSLGELLRVLGRRPVLAVGHSAGAAIVCRMSLDGDLAARRLVSLNGALLPFPGVAGQFLSPLAKLLVLNPLLPRLAAWRSLDPDVVDDLLRSTGSRLDEEGRRLYRRLARSPAHIAATLRMMAVWDLEALARELPDLGRRLVLAVGSRDRFVPPSEAERVRALVPTAQWISLPGLGHLAHEERPDTVADLLTELARDRR
ncbi:MAG: alpha/beta fold hydrolase [Myxococcota bacterium]|nr:alpha/beta fold hydrolase [Myxococcota bacterium]